MAKIIIRGQTVAINKVEEKDFKDQSKQGKLKIIYFTVADRDKHQGKNNTLETDAFYFCKAIGNTAEQIEKYCGMKDDKGKIISRKIYLEASPLQYKSTKEQKVDMSFPIENLFSSINVPCPSSVSGKMVNLTKNEALQYDTFIFEVKEFRMDDYVDDKKSSATESVSINIDLSSKQSEPYVSEVNEKVSMPEDFVHTPSSPLTKGNPFL